MFEKKKKDCSTLKPTTHHTIREGGGGGVFLIEGTKGRRRARACNTFFFDPRSVVSGGVYLLLRVKWRFNTTTTTTKTSWRRRNTNLGDNHQSGPIGSRDIDEEDEEHVSLSLVALEKKTRMKKDKDTTARDRFGRRRRWRERCREIFRDVTKRQRGAVFVGRRARYVYNENSGNVDVHVTGWRMDGRVRGGIDKEMEEYEDEEMEDEMFEDMAERAMMDTLGDGERTMQILRRRRGDGRGFKRREEDFVN